MNGYIIEMSLRNYRHIYILSKFYNESTFHSGLLQLHVYHYRNPLKSPNHTLGSGWMEEVEGHDGKRRTEKPAP